MTAVSKSVLRTIAISAVLFAASPAVVSAAEVEFTFQPESISLKLDAPRHERWNLRGWGRVDDEAEGQQEQTARSLFSFFGRRETPKPVFAFSDEPARSEFQRIAYTAPLNELTGRAASYGAQFDGRLTVTGERFDMYRLTAASADLPLNSYVLVSNTATGEEVVVRINDRKPAVDGEVLGLSLAAANRLGLDEAPGATIKVRYLGETPPARAVPMQVASR